MPNTKLTKAKWKNHLHYAKWLYILGIIATIAVCDIAFTTTRYQSPNEKAVVIQLVDSYADSEVLADVADQLLQTGKQYDETLELVEFYALAYSGDASGDYYGSQKFMVETMAGENDIFFVNKTILDSLVAEGYCEPLEAYEGLYAELTERFPDIEPYWANEIGEEIGVDENGYAMYQILDTRHAYAIPCDSLEAFIDLGSYDVQDKYMILAVTSENYETSFRCMLDMIELMRQPIATEEAVEP